MMMYRKFIFLTSIFLVLTGGSITAAEISIGVVNFASCITDSNYGKHEQQQMEKISQQFTSLMEETEKEMKAIGEKFEDQDYMDGLSPEAEQEMKMKQQALNEDLMKYNNQRYQILQQAEYFFMQKISTAISAAAETIAKNKNLEFIMRKDIAFFSDPNMDITKLVIEEMDKNFDEDLKKKDKEQKEKDKK